MVKLIAAFLFLLIFCNTYASFENPSPFNKIIRNHVLNNPDTTSKKSTVNSSYQLKDLPSHLFQNFSSTFSFDKNSIYWIAGIAGVTLGLISLDAKIDNNVKTLKNNDKWISNTSPFLTQFGAGYGIILSGAYAAFSIMTGYKKGEETSLLLLESAIYSTIWTRFGKVIFGRERPSSYYNNPVHPGGTWHGPLVQINNKAHLPGSSFDAFPSGHTSLAFSIATVFAEQYKSTYYVPIIAYSLATAVGISRTIEHTHWASDVFVGACIGYFSGKSSVMIYKKIKNANKQKEIKISFFPDIVNNEIGARLFF